MSSRLAEAEAREAAVEEEEEPPLAPLLLLVGFVLESLVLDLKHD